MKLTRYPLWVSAKQLMEQPPCATYLQCYTGGNLTSLLKPRVGDIVNTWSMNLRKVAHSWQVADT